MLEGADLANPSSAKDEMVSSMGESAEFKPGFLASLGMTRCGGRDPDGFERGEGAKFGEEEEPQKI